MKKITLWLLFALLTCWQVNAQTCSQTFTATGQDDDPTVLTINAADITCYGANPLTSLKLINPAGSLTSGFCTADGSSWYGFDLSIDGGPIITGCAAAFNNLDITGFTTLTITSHDDDVYSDGVTITIGVEATFVPMTPPSCVTVSSPVNGAINVSSSVVSWPAASGGATGYRLSVGSSPSATDVLNNFDVGNVLSYSLTGLVGGSTYYVTVFPYNLNGAATGCVESNFTTCDVFTVPFLETFDSTSSSESCWSILNVNGDGDSWNTSYATAPITGDQSANMYTDGNGGANNDWLISPRITLTGNQRLVFKYKVQSSFEPNDFRVMLSTTGNAPANFTTELASLASYSNTSPETMALDLTGVSGDVYFAWHVPPGGLDGWRIYIDDVVVEDIPAVAPNCVAITSPANGAVDVMNSNITWASDLDATGYYVSVGTSSGATDILNNFDVGNVLSYYLAGLVPGSTYYVSVYPYNGFGQATGCTESNFTTCDEVGDFVENFDGLAATGLIPGCWSRVLSDGVSTFASVGSDTDNFTAPYSIELYNSNSPATSNIMLVTPFINNLSAGTNRLRFVARNSTDSEDVIVGTMSNPSDASTFTPLETVDINGTFAQYIVDFTGYTGTDDYIAIKRLSTSTYTYVYLDNVIWEAVPSSAPTCATNVVATPHPTCGNYANSITWDVTSGADGYYVTIGTTTGGNNIANAVPVSGTSYNFTGNFNTTYFYTIVPYNANGSATGCTEQSFATNVNGCYCVSAPTSVDNLGITNVQIVSTNFANTVSTSPVYNDHTATPVTMSQGVNNNVQISFDTGFGYDYNIVIWIDANDDFNLDASEIVYTGLAPNTPIVTHNASFVMPGTMPLGQHRMRIVATDVLQTPANPCYSGTYGETADFTVNIVAASCTPPAATTTVVPACGTAQYSIDVNVTALGSGTPSITDGTTTWPVSAIGVVNVGPFASGSSVNLTLLHGSDTTCNLPLGNFVYFCPPTNDTCATAIPVTCGSIVTGSTANGASNTGGNAAADVWYSYSGAAGDVTVSLCNNTNYDSLLRIFDSCGGTQITSNDDGCGTQSQVTFTADGTSTYYIMVEGYGSNTGIFEMAVTCVLSNEDFDNSNFTAYPNPVKDVLNVSYTSEISSIRVINMIGQEVISKNINATSTQVDMSHLSAGTYIVNVTVGDNVKTLKVVKQ